MRPLDVVMMFYLVASSSCSPKIKDQVSLQWSICDTNPQAVLMKLGIEARDPDKLDPITYYDTSPSVYTPQGLMLRSKVRAGREITVVKVRLAGPKSHALRHAKACRWDRYGNETTFVCKRQAPLKRDHLWSSKQRKMAEEFQSDIAWKKLVGYGPLLNPKWKALLIDGYGAVLDDVAFLSLHLTELEVKVHRAKEETVYQAITEHLSAQGVVLCDRQEGKAMRLLRALDKVATQDKSQDMYTHDL
ncbi:hypothetical protein N7471_000150 [Penicillium samsonianum]|uniref:uncharacterized protein n=1 Tax=Penicillium samsonianum TaxID=1882272 RepID=UPI0025490475|nr:uncharacterized protein N7471_000150 [Penicillium samsonianum]KAJ6148951.1 hypothetical protein N7471_000150 [Penicillium samsonianum]